MPDRVEVYRGADHKWWWRRRAANHRILGDSGQGYWSHWWAKRAARRSNPGVKVEDRLA